MYSEWMKMSQEEKDSKVRSISQTSLNPGLNLDGAFDSSDDDIPICRKKTSNLVISSEDEAKNVETVRSSKKLKITIDSDSDVNLSDIDLESAPLPRSVRYAPAEPSSSQPGPSKPGPSKPGPSKPEPSNPGPSKPSSEDSGPSSSTRLDPLPSTSVSRPETSMKPSTVKRIVPLQEPGSRRGRAHPTLIICPTSLLSHWCQEIDNHIHPSVALKVKIHHGSHKAKFGADLNTYDIVLSTYGTLANELDADTSPLLRARWLRVILDEGHYIKNHRCKTAKAANQLNTVRRWVVTGTPIQNNLVELWSLVNWLQFDLYAEDLSGFKNQIERPCKERQEVGFERLQVLMDAICLRRTKNDKKPNGDPIVPSGESEDEDVKRVLEMSKSDFVYIPDSDEEEQMKKAIALSLAESKRPLNPMESIVVSDDEFDRMCDEPNMSLKEKLSKSSLSAEEVTATSTNDTCSLSNVPNTSRLPPKPKPSQV